MPAAWDEIVQEAKQERMRRAVKAFRRMQPMLTAYARAITRNPKVRVVLSKQSAMTDGTNIYYRPPLALGDEMNHDRRLCDQRDPVSRIKMCRACSIREEVMVNIYHEVGHIAFESFAKATDYEKKKALEQAYEERGQKVVDLVRKMGGKEVEDTYLGLASLINPYLHGLYNAIEDARVDSTMMEARPGIRVMMQASSNLIFAGGLDYDSLDDDEKSNSSWKNQPLNAQAGLACMLRAVGYTGWEDYLDPDVVEHTGTPGVAKLLNQLKTCRTASETFSVAVPLMEELRKYGYFKKPDEIPQFDPPPIPPEGGDQGDDDSSNGEGNSDSNEAQGAGSSSNADQPQQQQQSGSDVSDSQKSSGTVGDGAGDSPDTSTGGNVQGRGSVSPGMGDDSSDQGDQAEESTDPEGSDEVGDEESDSSGGDQQEEAEGSSGDRTEDGDSESGDGQGGSSGLADDSGDTSNDDVESGDEEQGSREEGGDREARDSDAAGGGASIDDQVEPSEPTRGDATNSGDGTDTTPESSEESDGSGSEDGSADSDQAEEASVDQDSDDDTSVPDRQPHEHGLDGKPCDCKYCIAYGTPEDLKELLEIAHAHVDENEQEQSKNEDDQQFDVFIVQAQYFDVPSAQVTDVKIITDGEPFFRDEPNPKTVDEGVIAPALMRIRRVFADNMRGGDTRNMRSGRINVGVLGRRAWSDDDRLFKKNHDPETRDYSVVIGIDGSSSSIGREADILRMSALAQADMCSRAGIRFAVYGHSGNFPADFNWGADDWENAGYEMHIAAIKNFDEPWSAKVRDRLMRFRPSGGNVDGHTLEFYRKRLDEENTTDRIIMYYTDGEMPATNYDEELEILQREIKICQRKEYVLMGVGVGTDSPKGHGLDTVEINSIDEIGLVVKHLEKQFVNRR